MSAFDRHEKSKLHRSALQLIPNQRNQTPRTVTQTENGSNERKQSTFGKIFTSRRFPGYQYLAIRGKEEATSNLAMLLQEQMEDVAELKQWLKQKKKSRFLSPPKTNKILNNFSSGVLTKLQQDIQKAKYYTTVLDET